MSNSLASLVKNRRTIHQFKTTPIPPLQLLEDAIAHALWAPNHHLSQPWQFHLIGAETVEKICLLNSELVRGKKGAKMAELKLQRWRQIPGWLVMSFDRPEDKLRRQEDSHPAVVSPRTWPCCYGSRAWG